MKYIGLSGKIYKITDTPFSRGGEGEICEVINNSDQCAKIYYSQIQTREIEEKLKVMIKNVPDKSVLYQIAWPLDIIYSNGNKFAGFIMNKIKVSGELQAIYRYPPTKYKYLTFEQKLIIAQNICAVIDAVHTAGFVFGDFNPCNIGVDMDTGHVAFWDTDTYHIRDKERGITYRCKVCMDGYVAPELLVKCKGINPLTGRGYNYEDAPLETFTRETDNFALAIHIFKLMMNGFTPFGGVLANSNESISTRAPGVGNVAIENDMYCYRPGYIHMSKAVADKNTLPVEIVKMFDRAFIDGRINPRMRPNAREWYNALEHFINNLEQCKVNPTHQYMKGLHTCPWCAIDNKYNKQISMMNQKNQMAIAPAPMQAGSRINYGVNVNQKRTNKKKLIKSEVIILIMCFGILLGFWFVDKVRWQRKTRPDPNYTVLSSVQEWNPHTSIEFTGTLENGIDKDEYTVSLKNGSGNVNGIREHDVDFFVVTSNSKGVDLTISGENGQSLTFNSNDENTYENKHTVTLTAGKSYSIDVYSESGKIDYYLMMKCN